MPCSSSIAVRINVGSPSPPSQQCEALSALLDLKVGMLVGSMGIDSWSNQQWEEALDAAQVLVMTYQVLYNMLSGGHLKVRDYLAAPQPLPSPCWKAAPPAPAAPGSSNF